MTTTPTEQEMAAASEISNWAYSKTAGCSLNIKELATIIHKHNEGLRDQLAEAKRDADNVRQILTIADTERDAANKECDQLAARCAELEKALTKLASMVWESRWVCEEQDYQDSVAFAAELRSDLISSPSSSLTRLQELERKAKALDWLEKRSINLNNRRFYWDGKTTLLQAIESAMRKDNQ